MPAIIRDCDPRQDRNELRSCIIEMQDFERALEPGLPRGAEMADAYVDLLLKRCCGLSGRVFVAEADQKVVGLIGVRAGVTPIEPDEDPTPYVYISDLVVLLAYRGRGVGHALLQHAAAYARNVGITVLRINVLAKNETAERLYRRFGFTDYRVELVKHLS